MTEDCLNHILLRHPKPKRIPNLENEIVKTVDAPQHVVRGRHGEHIAIRYLGETLAINQSIPDMTPVKCS
ncbi:hypothetical protein KAU55_03370 [Candidatus Bathyarchaeota archaeon]|nr:hypothetical protein [Candidatus Bathyarchaeota archaeon]